MEFSHCPCNFSSENVAELSLGVQLRTAKNKKAKHVTTDKESENCFIQHSHVKEEETELKQRQCKLTSGHGRAGQDPSLQRPNEIFSLLI